jgi:hypothetical protein
MGRNVTEALKAKVNTTVPDTASNGQVVYISANEFGELIDASYNRSLSANDVNVVNFSDGTNSGVTQVFNAITTDTTSANFEVVDWNSHTFDFYVTGTSVTVSVETSLDGTNFIESYTNAITGAKNIRYSIDQKIRYFRLKATSVSSATISGYYLGGR